MTVIWKRVLCFAVCFVAAIAISAFAEDNNNKLGPVSFSVDFGAEATDNRDATADRENNVDFVLSPQISALFDWNNRSKLSFHYIPSFRYRTNPSDTEHAVELYHDLMFSAEHKLVPRLKLTLDERFNYTDDPAILDNTTIRRDSSFLYNQVRGGVGVETSQRSLVDLSAQYSVKKYVDDVVANESDESSYGAGLAYKLGFTPTLGMVLGGDVTEHAYTTTATIDRGAMICGINGGLDKVFNPDFRGGVRVGFSTADYSADGVGSASAPYFNLAFEAAGTHSVRFGGGVGYSLTDADYFPYSSQEQISCYARTEWEVIKAKLILSLMGAYKLGMYSEKTLSDSAIAATGAADGNVTAIAEGFGVKYFFNPHLCLKFNQSFENTDSDISASATRNAVALGMSYQF